MGLYFAGGDRIQRGRGIGGLLRIASKLFSPIGSLAKKALESNNGKKIINAVKKQAIDSSINVVKDVTQGKQLGESLKDEFQNVKKNVKRKAIDIGIDVLKGERAKKIKGSSGKSKRKGVRKQRKNRDIFD